MQQGLVPMDTELQELKRVVANLQQQMEPMMTPSISDQSMILRELHKLWQQCKEASTMVEQQRLKIQQLKQQLQAQAKNSVTKYEFEYHKEEVQCFRQDITTGTTESDLQALKQQVQGIHN